jgi:hypothetical protein
MSNDSDLHGGQAAVQAVLSLALVASHLCRSAVAQLLSKRGEVTARDTRGHAKLVLETLNDVVEHTQAFLQVLHLMRLGLIVERQLITHLLQLVLAVFTGPVLRFQSAYTQSTKFCISSI